MERLYCPECGDYLEGGDGSMVDCHCGWKQERSIASDEEELETLRQRVAELEKERDKATQYWQIAEGRCDALMKQRDELLAAIALAMPVMDAHAGPSRLADFHAALASVKEKQNEN